MTNRVGRKIYRTNAGNRKRKVQKFFKALLAVIVIGLLVFVGYSVARPIYEYITDRDTSLAEDTRPWTPPAAENKPDAGDGDSMISDEGEDGEDGNAGSENKEVRF